MDLRKQHSANQGSVHRTTTERASARHVLKIIGNLLVSEELLYTGDKCWQVCTKLGIALR
jgi:hypothetical protein